MTLDSYFGKFRHCQQITLVGPFFDNSHDIEDPVIFVDSGSQFRKSDEGISVGDGDSIDTPLEIRLNPDKDFSDLAFALQNIPDHFREIDLAGFLGGRRDHELFNIGETHHFLSTRKSPTKVRFDRKVTGFSAGQWQFQRFGSFSVLTVAEALVRITGDCSYTCPESTSFPPLSSLGLSNIGSGTIDIGSNGPVFVLFEEL
jgi:thiamine pyrophosphokinase